MHKITPPGNDTQNHAKGSLCKTLLALILLLSPSLSPAASRIDPDLDPLLILGAGYESLRSRVAADCIVRTSPEARGGKKEKFRLQIIETYEELREQLGLEAEAGLNGVFFKAKGKAELDRQTELNDYTITALASVKVRNSGTRLRDISLTPVAQELLATAGMQTFRKHCGDEVVVGTETGGEFYGLITVETKTRAQAEAVGAVINASYKVFSAGAGFSDSTRQELGNAKTSVTVYRTGSSGAIPQTISDMIATATEFPNTVNEGTAVPITMFTAKYTQVIPEIGDYEIGTLVVAERRRTIRELARRLDELRLLASNIRYVIAHPGQFEPHDHEELDRAQQAIDRVRNALRTALNECRKLVAEDDACLPPAQSLPAVELPDRLSTSVDAEAEFHAATKDGDVQRIKELLRAGANVDARDKYNATSLHLATADRNMEMVQTLIDAGANPALLGKAGRSVLNYAVRKCWLNGIDTLLAHGADADVVDEDGDTLLHLAAQRCDWTVLARIWEVDQRVNSVNFRGETPLLRAVKKSNGSVISMLVEYGANVDASVGDEGTALHYAVDRKSASVVAAVLEAGADPDSLDEDSRSPIFEATSEEMVTLLRSYGADLDLAETKRRRTALHQAAGKGYLMALAGLINNGANLHLRDREGRTALHLAAERDMAPAVELLLDAGARANVRDVDGNAPVYLAAERGAIEPVRILMRRGAVLNGSNIDGDTVLHLVADETATYRVEAIAEMLVCRHPSLLSRKNLDGLTPLGVARAEGRGENARVLMRIERRVDCG